MLNTYALAPENRSAHDLTDPDDTIHVPDIEFNHGTSVVLPSTRCTEETQLTRVDGVLSFDLEKGKENEMIELSPISTNFLSIPKVEKGKKSAHGLAISGEISKLASSSTLGSPSSDVALATGSTSPHSPWCTGLGQQPSSSQPPR